MGPPLSGPWRRKLRYLLGSRGGYPFGVTSGSTYVTHAWVGSRGQQVRPQGAGGRRLDLPPAHQPFSSRRQQALFLCGGRGRGGAGGWGGGYGREEEAGTPFFRERAAESAPQTASDLPSPHGSERGVCPGPLPTRPVSSLRTGELRGRCRGGAGGWGGGWVGGEGCFWATMHALLVNGDAPLWPHAPLPFGDPSYLPTYLPTYPPPRRGGVDVLNSGMEASGIVEWRRRRVPALWTDAYSSRRDREILSIVE